MKISGLSCANSFMLVNFSSMNEELSVQRFWSRMISVLISSIILSICESIRDFSKFVWISMGILFINDSLNLLLLSMRLKKIVCFGAFAQ